MRLVTYAFEEHERVGVRLEGGIASTPYVDMLDVIRDGSDGLERLRHSAAEMEKAGRLLQDVELLAPVPRPGKLLFCGRNYSDHITENPNATRSEWPRMFSKLPSSIIGPGKPIVLPRDDLKVDYEVELALVLGKRARNVARDHAMEYVFGYTIVNDVSARSIQFTDQQTTLGKGLDTFCPMGPDLVLVDEIPDPLALTVKTHVNGEERQHAKTSEMLFPPAALIEYLSALVTLEEGDIVSTGTPAGVGCFRDPPVYLQPGDEVTVEVEPLGALSNPVRAGW